MPAALTLRFATPADAGRIAAIYAPFVLETHVSFEDVAPDAGEMQRRIAGATGILPWLVCEREDDVAGFAYATAHRARAGYRWAVDASAYVDEPFRRTGVGRRVYDALFAILTAQGYYTVFAGISLPNDASVAFHRRLGFETVAHYRNVGYKAGAWRSTEWLQLTLRPAIGTPAEPQPLRALSPTLVHRLLEPRA